MAKKVSMQIIADRLSISKFTVSQALSGKSGVGNDTRQRILKLAEALGYRVKPIAVSGRLSLEYSEPAVTSTVFIYMKEEFRKETNFWARVLDGLQAGCREMGWTYSFIDNSTNLSTFTDLVNHAKNPLGIIVIGISQRSHLLVLQNVGLPIVLVDHEDPLISADVILNANMEASLIACNHLIAQGCSSLIFIGRDSLAVSFKERWWGCKLAIEEWNKANPEQRCSLQKWSISLAMRNWQQQFEKRILAWEPHNFPNAILCANDQIAMQLLLTFKRLNITVPDQCRVVGIDNIEASADTSPSLTTIELAKEPLGMRAIQSLKRKLQNGHTIREKIILSAELIIRKSG
ncbi:LacI family DNA-binding transcriptional regulator [Paenibacillus psychroresistens]|nr:LacI family DNA-binding transcriptional regulator [Paenibacillus psychroresistens]